MKLRLLTFLSLFLAAGLQLTAQDADDAAGPKRTPEELRDLLGPVALYPDPLISLILPASTVTSDLVLAARAVKGGADPETLQDKPWDSAVKGLTRYPDTLAWLDENLEWTSQVGDAFVTQPVDVMEAIQDLRAKAKAMGNLQDTPEQKIVQDDTDIRILPAQPDYIFEPRYDPQVVYYERPVAGPVIYFGAPLLVGAWLAYDFDWHRHHLYRGEWHHHDGWDYRHEGREREIYINNHIKNAEVWHVDTKRRIAQVKRGPDRVVVEKPRVVVHPTPLVQRFGKGEVRRGEAVDPRHREGMNKGEVIRREGEVVRPGTPMGNGRPGGEKGGKGKVIAPKTTAPGVPEGRPHIESKEGPGKPKGESFKGKGESHIDTPKPKAHVEEGKPHVDTPKPRPHVEDPKPKAHVEDAKPKHMDAPKAHTEGPKPHTDAPKAHTDAPKPHTEAPKHVDAPKPKPHTEAPKGHAEGSKKKDDKDKDKKN